MKTKQLLSGLMIAGAVFASNGQSIIESSNLTSGGLNAGVMGGTGSTFYGYYSGAATTTTNNTFVGAETGRYTTTGASNTFLGSYAGDSNISGSSNVFLGSSSGNANTSGANNIFLGASSGAYNTSGNANIMIGNMSGIGCTTGTGNVYIGQYVASGAGTGSANVYIGHAAGNNNTGSNNVFLGASAGTNSSGSNLLFIDNTSVATPLIWGNFLNDELKFNGKVGIGMGSAAYPANAGGVALGSYKLFVNGGVLAKEVRVATTWADYVFEDCYKLPTLDEVERFIEENGHLPNVPSAKQVEEDGIEVGQMARIQQEKIEELTLYVIQQKKEIEELKAQMQILLEQKK